MGGLVPGPGLLWSKLNSQPNIKNQAVCRANPAWQDVSKLQAKSLSSGSQGKSHEANSCFSSGLSCLLPAGSPAEPGRCGAGTAPMDLHLHDEGAWAKATTPLWDVQIKRKNVADFHRKLLLIVCTTLFARVLEDELCWLRDSAWRWIFSL